jgi:chromosome partitioning protein
MALGRMPSATGTPKHHPGKGAIVRIIAIINQKGGCGKTTSAINLSAIFARRGLRTLLVDMDPQSHCAVGLGIPESRLDYDIGDALLHGDSKRFDFSRIVWPAARNLDLAPSRMRLAGLEARAGGLAEKPDKERRLSMTLQKLKAQYDVVCIDCSPSVGLLTFNALAAANMVLIPVETGFFSLQGASRQVHTVRSVAKRLGSGLPIWILPTIHDESSAVSSDLLEELRRRFGQRVMPTVIRRDPRLREAAGFGQPIIDFDPNSIGSMDYTAAAHWLLEQVLTPESIEDNALEDELGNYETRAEGGDTETPVIEVSASIRPPSLSSPLPAPAAARPEPTAPQDAPIGVSRAEELAQRARALALKAAGVRGVLLAERPQPASKAEAKPEATTAAPMRQEQESDLAVAEAVHSTLIVEPKVRTSPTSHGVPLLGVRPTRQGALFVQPATLGTKVSIAGEFNGWNPAAGVMKLNEGLGVYELTLRLPAGRHQYRLVVDGAWMADPYNRNRTTNPFGEPNSVLEIL